MREKIQMISSKEKMIKHIYEAIEILGKICVSLKMASNESQVLVFTPFSNLFPVGVKLFCVISRLWRPERVWHLRAGGMVTAAWPHG